MGSIYHLNRNPRTWTPTGKKATLKPEYGGEHIEEYIYGELDDYPTPNLPLSIYIRDSIMQKLHTHAYTVDFDSHHDLIIYDEHKQPVTPLQKNFIY